MNTYTERLRRNLHIFLSIAGMLTILGVVFVYSASAVYGIENVRSAHAFFARHFLSLLGGALGFTLFYIVPLATWRKYASALLGLSLILTGLVLTAEWRAVTSRLFPLLVASGYRIVPRELLKFFSCLYLGHFVAKREQGIPSFWRGYFPLVIIFGFASVLLLQHSDAGSVLVLLLTLSAVCFAAQYKTIYLLGTWGAALFMALGYAWGYPAQASQVLSYVNPWHDPHGAGYEMIQSLMAIGSGSWWGTKTMYTKQLFFYLPVENTDFVFSIIAQEVGFLGCALVIAGYCAFAIYGMRIVTQLHDRFAAYMTLGFILSICLQVVLNMMVATGMLPLDGFELPFISFSGHSLVIMGCMLGLIANAVSAQRETI